MSDDDYYPEGDPDDWDIIDAKWASFMDAVKANPITTVIHIKKCVSPYFEKVRDWEKQFEIRLNDCGYTEGDFIIQRHYCPRLKKYLEGSTFHKIGFMTDFEQKPGYVVFGLLDPSDVEEHILKRKLKEVLENDR